MVAHKEDSLESMLERGRDVLMDQLDKEKGKDIADLSIFQSHSQYFEREFLEDMEVRFSFCRRMQVLT